MAIPEKLAEVMNWNLRSGGHDPERIADGEACVMEAVAYVAGLPLSDQPDCTCPVIASFLRSWNDGLPNNAERDRLLKPLIVELIGTKSTAEVQERRSYMALDWLIRVHTPAWLNRVESLKQHALALSSHEEIADLAGATAAGEKVRAAWDAAWAAARDAAGAAAWAAAWAAARAAAGDAAWAAARAAAGAAAGAAAWAAAEAAAGDALQPTVKALQVSALALVERMIEVRSIPMEVA